MIKKTSVLHSEYIIDGVKMDFTPYFLLNDCLSFEKKEIKRTENNYAPIIDESIDYIIKTGDFSDITVKDVLEKCLAKIENLDETKISIPHSHFAINRKLAKTIIDCLWKKGDFTLEDLCLDINWVWDSNQIGNSAAFYLSTESACQYLFDLGVTISNYEYTEQEGVNEVYIEAKISDSREEDIDSYDENEIDAHPHTYIEDVLYCPNRAIQDENSLFIYIPFDTCSSKLGDSILESCLNNSSEKPPHISDAVYLVDSFEVVRELVEDKIALAGKTVSDGGLICALAQFTDGLGIDLDPSKLLNSEYRTDIIRELFTEIPGVIIQIKESDMDYLDSQLILQEIAYYPIAKYNGNHIGINILEDRNSAIHNILESILRERKEDEEVDDLF